MHTAVTTGLSLYNTTVKLWNSRMMSNRPMFVKYQSILLSWADDSCRRPRNNTTNETNSCRNFILMPSRYFAIRLRTASRTRMLTLLSARFVISMYDCNQPIGSLLLWAWIIAYRWSTLRWLEAALWWRKCTKTTCRGLLNSHVLDDLVVYKIIVEDTMQKQ